MTTISVDDLLRFDGHGTIVNAGDRQGRREIRGAVRYRPQDLLEADHLALPIAHDAPLILYAEHGPGERLSEIGAKMQRDGFADVRLFDATLDEYERAGGALQEPSVEQVVPPARPEEAQALDRRI